MTMTRRNLARKLPVLVISLLMLIVCMFQFCAMPIAALSNTANNSSYTVNTTHASATKPYLMYSGTYLTSHVDANNTNVGVAMASSISANLAAHYNANIDKNSAFVHFSVLTDPYIMFNITGTNAAGNEEANFLSHSSSTFNNAIVIYRMAYNSANYYSGSMQAFAFHATEGFSNPYTANNAPMKGMFPYTTTECYMAATFDLTTMTALGGTANMSGYNQFRLDPVTNVNTTGTVNGYNGMYIDSIIFCNSADSDALIRSRLTAIHSLGVAGFSYSYEFKNGSTTVSSGNYSILNPLSTPTAPTKNGYTFKGWKPDYNQVNSWSSSTTYATSFNSNTVSSSPLGGPVVFQAQWDLASYKITFDENGGSTVSDISYTIEDSTAAFPQPTKTGYTFAGWKVTSNDGNWSGTYSPGQGQAAGKYGNVTLQAQWTANNNTVTWNNWDGTLLATTTVASGNTPSYTGSTPTRASTAQYSYTFTGWSPALSAITGNVTYTAQFKQSTRSYTITFKYKDASGNDKTSTPSVAYGSTPTAPDVPTSYDSGGYRYTFTGWDKTIASVTGATTYTAQYSSQKLQYTVKYNANGGSGTMSNSTFDCSTDVTLRTNAFTKTGYSFAGWATSAGGAVVHANSATINRTSTDTYNLYAVWTPITYTVSYNGNGNTGGSTANSSHTYDTAKNLTTNGFTKTGYSFNGWNTKSDGSGTAYANSASVKNLSSTQDATVTLYAQWTANSYEYNIVYKSSSGKALGSTTATFNFGTTNTITAPAKIGYTTPASQSVAWDTAGTKTITFTYVLIEYDITYELNGGVLAAGAPTSYTIEDSFKLPSATKAEDASGRYYFSGWTWEENDTPVTDYTVPAGTYLDLHFVANWLIFDTATGTGTLVIYSPKDRYSIITGNDIATTNIFVSNTNCAITTSSNIMSSGVYNACDATTAFIHYNTVSGDPQLLINLGSKITIDNEDAVYDTIIFIYRPAYANENYSAAGMQFFPARIDGEYGLITEEYSASFDRTYSTYGSSVTPMYQAVSFNIQDLIGPSGADFIDRLRIDPTASVSNNGAYDGMFIDSVVLCSSGDAEGIISDRLYQRQNGIGDKAIPSTYTFKDGDTTLDSGTYSIRYPLTTPDALTKEGYNFLGWRPVTSNAHSWDSTVVYGAELSSNATGVNAYNANGIAGGNVTFIAEWEAITYNIIYELDGGTNNGDNPNSYTIEDAITLKDPTKTGYTFAGWTPSNTIAAGSTGNKTFTATWTINKYTITWYDEDGETVLGTVEVEYGQIPTFTGETPTKDPTVQYTYTFDGWSPDLVPATQDTSYNAVYVQAVRKYTITWKNDDGSLISSSQVEYGETPVFGATPVKSATAQYTYTFTGWSPEIVEVTEDAAYTATFQANLRSYTITWNNYDGTKLTTTTVEYGTVPTYTGETPTRAGDAQYTYTFIGWSPSLEEVTGAATYTAQFDATTNTYTITWKDENGTILETDTGVAYGATPSYDGETPTKAATAQYTYTFKAWSPVVANVTGNATYTATYNATTNTYTITWVDGDGETLKTDTLEYGAMPAYSGEAPTKTATAQYTYTFTGWDPTIVAVVGNATYTAQFDATTNTYTITWKNWDDSTITTTVVEYGTVPTYTGETPTRDSDGVNEYTFNSWTPELVAVTGDAAYTATFTTVLSAKDLTITVNCDIPDQYFVFTVTNTKGLSMEITLKDGESITIVGAQVDTYTITNNAGWSWRLSIAANENSKQIDLSATQSVTFNFTTAENVVFRTQWINSLGYESVTKSKAA